MSDNLEIAKYLLGMVERLLEASELPLDSSAEDYVEQVNIQRGVIKAAGIVREEATRLRTQYEATSTLVRALHGASCPNEIYAAMEFDS